MPLSPPSLPETARGFLGTLSSSIRLRANALFAATTSSHQSIIEKTATTSSCNSTSSTSSSSFSFSYSSSSPSLPLLASPHACSSSQDLTPRPSSAPSTSCTSPGLEEVEYSPDSNINLEMPSKRRFEPGFPFQFKSRNSSAGSIFSSLSASLRQSNQKVSQQQQQEQLQVSVKESKIRQIQLELDASSNSQSQTGSSESGSPKSLIIPPRNESRSDAHIKIDVRSNIEVMAVTGANINMRVESNPNVKTDTDESQDYAYMPPPRSIPEKVLIHGLPKYFPEDNIGRNAKRNEMYARIRLKALREHQKVLVQLLSDLLGMDNMYRRNQSQNQTSRDQPHSVSEQGEQRQCGNRNQGSDTHTSSECFNKLSTCGGCRQALRLQKRELAVRGYQKAIIDLWHIDQNMCYWLSRYIQTARRVAQSIEFMFAIPVMCGAAEGITDDGSMQALSKEHVAIKVTDRESRHSLERMSILMSDHSVIAGSNDNFTSSTPSIIDEDAESKGTSSNATASKVIIVPTLPPLSTFSIAPTIPPPPLPAPSPPRSQLNSPRFHYSSLTALFPPPPLPSSTSHPTVSVLPIRGHSSYLHHQERQRQDEKDIQTRPEHASNRIRAYFQDLDCLEASIFVGFHMQSHQKSNESLNQFNKESNRSRIVIQRFNIAKEAYEHQILVKPWKMRSHGK